MIDRLEQLTIEDSQSKRNIFEWIKSDLDNMFTKEMNQCVSDLKDYIAGSYYESKNARITQLRDPESIILHAFVACIPIKTWEPPNKACAAIANHLNLDNVFDGIKIAADILPILWANDIIDIQMPSDSPTGAMRIVSEYQLSDKILHKIEKTQFPYPMVCIPDEWTNNFNGGYINHKECVVLKKWNKHSEEQCLDVNNILQNIPLQLSSIIDMEEIPGELEPKALKQFNIFAEESKQTYKFFKNKTFYFVWKNDSRGRCYSKGYHINIQGSEYKKACIEFKTKKVING